MVNDLIDEPAKANAAGLGPDNSSAARFHSGNGAQAFTNEIDKESKALAVRIKKCPHFKCYKQYLSNLGGSFSVGGGKSSHNNMY